MTTLPKPFEKPEQLMILIINYFYTVGIDAKAIIMATKRTRGRPPKSQKDEQPKTFDPESSNTKQDPPTITGLALYLGFDSLDELDRYERKRAFKAHLKRARLIIASVYEKKLHNSYTSGPIFALKALGWNVEKSDNKNSKASTTLNVKIINTGPEPASNEKGVNILPLNKPQLAIMS